MNSYPGVDFEKYHIFNFSSFKCYLNNIFYRFDLSFLGEEI